VQKSHKGPQIKHLERLEDAVGTALAVDHGVIGEGVVARLRQHELDEASLGGGEIQHL